MVYAQASTSSLSCRILSSAQGLYAAQLAVYLRLFGRSQLLVLDSKTFAANPADTTNRVLKFGALPSLSAHYSRFEQLRATLPHDAALVFLTAGLAPHDFTGAATQNEQGFWVLEGKASKSNTQKPYVFPCYVRFLETATLANRIFL